MNDFGDVFLPGQAQSGPTFWRATVIRANPLSVRRDDGTVMPEPPENFAGTSLSVGDRVFGITNATRATIIGVSHA